MAKTMRQGMFPGMDSEIAPDDTSPAALEITSDDPPVEPEAADDALPAPVNCAGEPITTYASSSPGAEAYRALAREVLQRCHAE